MATIEERLAALETRLGNQTPIRFPQGMNKVAVLNLLDKVLLGVNADGSTKVADVNQIANLVSASVGSGIEPTVEPSTTLPAPEQAGKIMIMKGGSYTQPDGTTPLVAPDNSFNVGFWDGEEWKVEISIETEADLSGYATLADINGDITEGEDKAPSGDTVHKYATPLTSSRILPNGNAFDFVDRPDISGEWPLIITDEDGKVIARIGDAQMSIAKEYDRPDLAVVYVDEAGRLFDPSQVDDSNVDSGNGVDTESVKEIIKESELIQTFWEPPVQAEYNMGSSNEAFWLDYPYWDIFDEVRTNQKIAQGYDPYITRELLGKSSKGGYDIYRYEFKPVNPTRKVIVFGGTHGSERIAPMVLQRFFKALCEDWMHNPALMWARHNVHFVTIPLVSPYGFHHRNRRVWETDPFPATWTKSGEVLTVTFDPASFPTTNPNVSAANYFTAHDGVAGKMWLSLINSSDPAGTPDNGYKIQTVINGQSVRCLAPSGGASSGSCEIFISTDPNRGFDLEVSKWADSEPADHNMQAYTDPVAVPFNNKGTKPYALNESKFIRDTFDLHADATFAVDMHNGAADYDTRIAAGYGNDPTPYLLNNAMHASFTDGPMPFSGSLNNTAGQYGIQNLGINSFTIEWGNHSLMDTIKATDSQRWMSNFLLICSRFYNKKLND